MKDSIKMKVLLLSIIAVIVLASCISCKKSTNKIVNNTSTNSTYISPLTGTWVNSVDITDHFRIHDTLVSNCNSCINELVIIGCNYINNPGTEYSPESKFTIAPGHLGGYTYQSINYIDYIYYNNNIIKIQINNYPTAGTNKTLIFNKQ